MSSNKGMRDPEILEPLARALGDVLGLAIEPDWMPGVAQQLAITLAMADILETVEIGEEASPAPVYRL